MECSDHLAVSLDGFGDVPTDQWLHHVGTTAYPGGLVLSEYLVRRSGP